MVTEIRQLRAEDYEERMALSQFAFQLRLSPEELESRRGLFRPEQDWGAFDEQGELLSALSIIPFETWIQGRKLAMGGIAGVATWPDARRRGCVSQLLVRSLETMRTNGQTISMLHPFSFPFYHKYGYEMTVERKKYTIETKKLPARTVTPGQVKRMPKPDIEVLDGIYSIFASRYSGTIIRTRDWWENKILSKNGTVAVYYNESNVPEGYVFYQIADRIMTIHDWVSANEVSRRALWTYVGNHDSMINEVTMIAPADDPLPFLLPEPRIKQELLPYFMSRIVDAEAFAGLYPWAHGVDGEAVTLVLSDEHAPWNNGAFRLSWSAEGQGRLERLNGQSESAAREPASGAVLCDIQALTAMLAGNRSPLLLEEVGRISGSRTNLELLASRIPQRTTHLMDFF
ncbi:GNAT family N-acetyltransferase [Cohnella cholangitidis]|uniref:GNAT family N-acetyltransferase n=1 Tax=Cohnella cholangitidis TaxID=2598458 RepID=A0A7G5C089_9BACL|nr:GNAT family N-acetyltransferase [Cohnella cholangitidis]QMV42623.1 GNAT family N-acetyltransferase [Cohnella cholangitidis]